MKEENDSNLESKKEELFNDNLKPLRTYQGDVEKAVGENHVSVATVAIAEQKRKIRENEYYDEKTSNLKNKFFIYFGIFLFFVGVFSVGYIYYIKSQNDPLSKSGTGLSIINYNEKISIDLASSTRENLLQKISHEIKNYNKPINSILYIEFMFNSEPAETADILSKIGSSASQTLVRSLDKKNYMFGVYSRDKNEPFIILKTVDYGTSFAGMLKWESSIINDFGDVFNIDKNSISSAYVFIDESIQNKDLRVLKDPTGKTILLYSFVDKNTIVIAGSENTLSSVYSKIITSKMVR